MSKHETPRDCPWSAIARAAHDDPAHVLATHASRIWSDVARDSAHGVLHAAWGQSKNFDELAHAPIIDTALLSALGKRLGVSGDGEPDGKIVHAGLQHTYGYMFSTLWTQFGYKRARWVDGELDRGLGLQAGMLGPTPPHGTLYSNATCALVKLAFEKTQPFESVCRHVPIAVQARQHDVLLEHAGAITLRTDLVPLGSSRVLIIYSSIENGAQKLLTCFPADQTTANAIRALPKRGPIEAHYNAYVPGLSSPVDGTREMLFSTAR